LWHNGHTLFLLYGKGMTDLLEMSESVEKLQLFVGFGRKKLEL